MKCKDISSTNEQQLKDKERVLTTPSQNPDFSKGVSISTGSTSSYSSISGGTAKLFKIKKYEALH